MAHYIEDKPQHLSPQHYSQKPMSVEINTKIQENKGSFCIDALLARNEDRPNSPETSRSISPTSSHSQSPPISPGSEEIHPNPFVPRPGLLNQIYPSANAIYGYQTQPHVQTSAFHSLDGAGMVQKVQIPVNHNHQQLHQMQLEWLARTGMFYPRLPDLTASFIKKCARNDPDLNQCIVDHGNLALPHILKGIPALHIPPFYPFNLGTIKATLTPNLEFYYESGVSPSKDYRISSANFDFEQNLFQLDFSASRVLFTGNFTLKGSIDNNPVLEKGLANFTYNYTKYTYSCTFESYKKGEETYGRVKNSSLISTFKAFSDTLYHIKSLTELTLEQEESLKNILDKNLKLKIKTIIDTIGNKVISSILDTFFGHIPENQIFKTAS